MNQRLSFQWNNPMFSFIPFITVIIAHSIADENKTKPCSLKDGNSLLQSADPEHSVHKCYLNNSLKINKHITERPRGWIPMMSQPPSAKMGKRATTSLRSGEGRRGLISLRLSVSLLSCSDGTQLWASASSRMRKGADSESTWIIIG